MNFLRSITQQIQATAGPAAGAVQPVAQPPAMQVVTKEYAFTHSPFVYILRGNYAGEMGKIVSRNDQKLEISLRGKEPYMVKLFEIDVLSTAETPKEKEDNIRRVIAFKDETDGKLKLGMLAGLMKKGATSGENVFGVIPYDLDYNKSQDIWQLLDELSSKLKNSSSHNTLLKRIEMKRSPAKKRAVESQSAALDEELDNITSQIKNMDMESDMESLLSQMKKVKMTESIPTTQRLAFLLVTPDKFVKGMPSPQEIKQQEEEKKLQALLEKITESRGLQTEQVRQTPAQPTKPSLDQMIIISGANKGLYGKFLRVIDEQRVREFDKYELINPQYFTADNNQAVAIGTTGTFQFDEQNKTKAKITNIYPESYIVKIYLPNEKREILLQTLCDITGVETDLSPITNNDIFIIDIELTNGHYFQVRRVLEDERMYGVELTPDVQLERYIKKEDISTTIDGFSVGELRRLDQPVLVEQDTSEYVEPQIDEDGEEVSYRDENLGEDEEQEESDDVGYAEAEGDAEKETQAVGEQDQYVDGYADTQRTQMTLSDLTQQQEKIRSMFVKYLGVFGINVRDMMKYAKEHKTAVFISQIVDAIKKKVNNYQKNFWKATDEKYIVAVYVYYEMLNAGMHYYTQNTDPIAFFIENMVEEKIFRKGDITNSIFVTNGWSSAFQVDNEAYKRFYKLENFAAIYRIMFMNAHREINSYKEDRYKINIELQQQPPMEIIPIQRKKPSFEKNVALISEVLAEKIPSTAKKIVWGSRYKPVLEEFKNTLRNSIKNARNETTRQVYTYMLDNLEQAPFALKRMKQKIEREGLKLDIRKHNELRKMYKALVQRLREATLASEEKSRTAQQSILSEREQLRQRREALPSEQTRKRIFEDDESETEMDTQTTSDQPRSRYWRESRTE